MPGPVNTWMGTTICRRVNHLSM